MSKDTWNFPSWQDRDAGPGEPRGVHGTAPFVHSQTLFGNALSGVISFLITSETAVAADQTGTHHWLHSIGYVSSGTNGLGIYVKNDPAGTGFITMNFYDRANSVQRFLYQIGDEDGVSGLQVDKWYQLAFSAGASGFQYVMNGSTTPLIEGTPTSNPGSLNLNEGSERWGFCAGAANSQPNWFSNMGVSTGWSSLVRGPCALEGSELDLSDSAVRARIFDDDGNLKPPGENGSLWFNDTYTTAVGFKPDVYMVDGIPRMEKGSLGLTFDYVDSSPSYPGQSDCPGGLRKFYE